MTACVMTKWSDFKFYSCVQEELLSALNFLPPNYGSSASFNLSIFLFTYS